MIDFFREFSVHSFRMCTKPPSLITSLLRSEWMHLSRSSFFLSCCLLMVGLLPGCSVKFTEKAIVIGPRSGPRYVADAASTPAVVQPQPPLKPLVSAAVVPSAEPQRPLTPEKISAAPTPVPASPAQSLPPFPPAPALVNSNGVVEMGTRLELFVDDFMIAKLSGDAQQVLHKPEPKEVVFVTDKPWEGNACNYYSLFQEGNLYKMYYRTTTSDYPGAFGRNWGIAYAESTDGIQWKRRLLGRVAVDGNSSNNRIDFPLSVEAVALTKNDDHHPPRGAKYIGTANTLKGLGLVTSANGFDWQAADPSLIPVKGTFDSQNTLFWDMHAKLYRCYYRVIKPNIGRAIMTTASRDLKNWSEAVDIQYPGTPDEQLYTNAIQCYPRAPHILVGFPTIYLANPKQQVAPEFMSSRDGVTFHRWTEKIIPVTAPKDRDGNRSNYMAWGFLVLPGKPDEYSFYATEAYEIMGEPTRLRRFTYRVDGFVSVSAGTDGGEVLTKPLTFDGHGLVINAATKPAGSVRVEIQDEQGQPLAGTTLSDCQPFTGDSIEHVVSWQKGSDVSSLVGKTVQVRFVLQNADLYSFRFK
jgi:hypothetical protein